MRIAPFLLGFLLLSAAARAQTTRTVSSAADSGPGSLREALAAVATGDQVVFAPALAGQTIRLSSQLTLSKSITLDGRAAPNLRLDGQNQNRILRISYDFISVSIRDLTFQNGRAADADPATRLRGGAIELLDPNTLRLENCRFLGNVGERGGALFVGYGAKATVIGCEFDQNDGSVANDGFSAGAISTYGGGPGATVLANGVGGQANLEVRDCRFTRNKGIVGGGIYVLLGGLTVENCLFRRNEARSGGAIFQDGANGTEKDDQLGGTTTIRNCQADSNLVRGEGGAFFLWGYSNDKYLIENTVVAHNRNVRGGQFNTSKGGAIQVRDRASLALLGCTLLDNSCEQQGGGLWLDCRGPEGIRIDNCTFSANRASTADGKGDIGGAAVFNSPASTRIRISNATFVDNRADRADGCIWIAGGANAQNLTFTNCLFQGNRAGTGSREQTVNFPALGGGGNFAQSASGGAVQNVAGATYRPALGLASAPVLLSVAGRLAPVPVHPLPVGSSLVDAGVAVVGLTTDQLGTPRPLDGNQDGTAQFDPGALEYRPQLALAATNRASQSVGFQLWPNPATDRINFSYVLPRTGPVRLVLRDAAGRQVAVLLEESAQPAGPHALAVDVAALHLPAGLYFGELRTAAGRNTQRLVVVER